MKNWKSHLDMSTSQRNGILILILILIASLAFQYFWMLPKSETTKFAISEEDQHAILEEIDSLKRAANEAKKPKIYPFNPNFLTDFKAYQLGISTQEFDRLKTFRNQDQWINSPEEFQNITGVSDSLFNEIKVYFKFPDWVEKREALKSSAEQQATQKSKSISEKKDINKATEEDLKTISGIGEVLAKRIVRTRSKLDGFIDDIQLKDVYGLKYETREKLLAEFTVKDKKEVSKININTATVVELTDIPYFDYELAREVVHFVKVRDGISDFEELAKIYDFPMHKIDRIKLYLKIDE